MSDMLSTGRTFRCLVVLDEPTREALAMEVAHSLPSTRVIEILERLRVERGLPPVLITDNGSEFASRAFDAWAYARNIRIDYIQRGKPIQNCFVERFNGSLRDECLNAPWFPTLQAAQQAIEQWRVDCNRVRPHRSLGERTPEEFALDSPGNGDNCTLIHNHGFRE